jgi:hypothetical protein
MMHGMTMGSMISGLPHTGMMRHAPRGMMCGSSTFDSPVAEYVKAGI